LRFLEGNVAHTYPHTVRVFRVYEQVVSCSANC
jgi:hypothetical protein